MKEDTIRHLLEKYYNGETDVNEEKILEDYFMHDEVSAEFSIDKEVFCHLAEMKENDEITVYYKRKIKADVVIENVSDNYSEKLELYVDVIAEDKCKNEYRVQFFIPYADFSGNFDIAIGDSQTAHSFEATSLASVCGNGSSVFWKMIVFGANAEDVTE